MQRNDLCSPRGRLADFLHRMREIFLRIRRAFHLHQADGKFICHETILTCSFELAGVLFCSSFLGGLGLSICAQLNTNDVAQNVCVLRSDRRSIWSPADAMAKPAKKTVSGRVLHDTV